MKPVAMITIGESPREDLVPYLQEAFTGTPEVWEFGVLDGLDRAQREALAPEAGEVGSCGRLRDGTSALVVYRKVLPVVQFLVDKATAQGAGLVVILCGRDWSAVRSRVPLVNPGTLFPAIITSVASGRRLGVIKPLAAQLEPVRTLYGERGIETWAEAASPYSSRPLPSSSGQLPYSSRRLEDAARAAERLRDADVDLIWMSCVDMDEAMRSVVAEISGRPVILARSLLARVIDELVIASAACGGHSMLVEADKIAS